MIDIWKESFVGEERLVGRGKYKLVIIVFLGVCLVFCEWIVDIVRLVEFFSFGLVVDGIRYEFLE